MLRLSRRSDLANDDEAILFPSLADLAPDGKSWRVSVSGLVYRNAPQRSLGKRMMLGLLRRAMRATKEQFSSDLFIDRISGFLVDAGKGKSLSVQVGDQVYSLSRPTRRTGYFFEEVSIPVEQLAMNANAPAKLPFSLFAPNRDQLPSGHVYLVPQRGLSIISDIDDTLKDTGVLCRKSMLSNTFLTDFALVPGMAPMYRGWAEAGAMFHYVSSSPWQLYSPLAGFFASEAVPEGSFHLRAFRLRDHMLRRLFMGRRPAKAGVVKSILQRFPLRKFVLVGDSGEHDPEIYGTLARKFPNQVAAVLIRRIPGQEFQPYRMARAFRRLPTSLWQVFEDPNEVADRPRELLEQVSS